MGTGIKRGRLWWRLYGASVLQILLSTLVVFVAIQTSVQPIQPLLDSHARYVAQEMADHWNDDDRLVHHTQDAAAAMGAQLTVRDNAGRLRAASGSVARNWWRPPMVSTMPIVVDGKPQGTVVVHTYFEPSWVIPLLFWCVVFLFAGLGSMLVARGLVRTIQDVARAAHALGQGDLKARSTVEGPDELGQLAGTFNRMAAYLERTVGAQSELLANVSHELRTPLARMRVALDLALEGERLDEQALADISGDLSELETLVSEIIATARLDVAQGRANGVLGSMQTQPVVLKDLMRASAERFASRNPGRVLTLSFPPDDTQVQAANALLRRAVDNLLENAARYSEVDKPIVLAANTAAQGVVIEIKDQGVGMTPEDLERAFEPFFRSDRSRNRASRGLGLGLTLTQRIVEAHGGHVDLQSTPGVGTTARVELPLVRHTGPLT